MVKIDPAAFVEPDFAQAEAKLNLPPSRVRSVRLGDMFSDTSYQRPLDDRQANKIAAKLNLDAIGNLCLSRRPNGKYAVVDGQTRRAGLYVAGYGDDDYLECEVFIGLTGAQEAELFAIRNTRRKVNPTDMFRAKVIAEDPDAVALDIIATEAGWAIRDGNGKGYLGAVATLERVYALSKPAVPNVAAKVLAVIAKAWGHGWEGVNGAILEGLGLVLHHYGPAINLDDMAHDLGSYAGGPTALVGSAKGRKAVEGGSIAQAAAHLIVKKYNLTHRGSNKIAPWKEG